MVATEFSHYRVLSRLGAGGMGEVFLAEDLSLHRKVALKFLLPAAGREDADGRLLREARAAAHLDHPFICKVYEVGEHDGRPFLAIEYVDGVTVRDRLAEGRLPLNEALRIACEVADALHFAHTRGIIHRDLKPANVMLGADGHVKVMDFGIAKQLAAPVAADAVTAALPTATRPGELTGTLAYMSPEQLRGETVDQRSDVFAFGMLLNELLTGIHPFMRPTTIEIANAILNEPPPPLELMATGGSPLLAHVVVRCLEKDRARRYQSLSDVRIELESLQAPATGTVTAGPPKRRTAWVVAALAAILIVPATVHWIRPLPFLTGEPALAFKERDWLIVADFNNLTGESVFDSSLRLALEVAIAQSKYVNVYPQDRVTATLRRMQRDPSGRLDARLATEVAERDGVRGIVACDIAKLESVYSITARLVDPQTGASVFTDSITAKGKDGVLDALDQLATRVRASLGESMGALSDQNRRLPTVTTSSLDALKMYADSLRQGARNDTGGDQLLRQAVALDPDFALAHAELGRRYYIAAEHETRELGEKHYQVALKLGDRLTLRERLWIEASAEDSRGRREQAVDAYKAYVAQYPDDVAALFRLAWTEMAGLQRYADAIDHFKRVIALNPSESAAHVNLASAYAGMGDNHTAIAAYGKAFALTPALALGVFVNHEYGFTLVDVGRLKDAAAVFERMKREAPPNNRARGFRSSAFLEMYQGRYGAAIKELQQAIALNQTHRAAISEYRDRLILHTALTATGRTADAAAEWAVIDRLTRTLSLGPEWLWEPVKRMARAGRATDATRLLGLMQKTLSTATAASAANRSASRDQALLDLAQAELELASGRIERALDASKRADAALNLVDSMESVAVVLLAAGRVEEAVSRYEELLKKSPFGLEAQEPWFRSHLSLGRLYERQGRPEDARRLYASLLERWKDGDPAVVLLKTVREQLARLPAPQDK